MSIEKKMSRFCMKGLLLTWLIGSALTVFGTYIAKKYQNEWVFFICLFLGVCAQITPGTNFIRGIILNSGVWARHGYKTPPPAIGNFLVAMGLALCLGLQMLALYLVPLPPVRSI